MGYRIQYGQTMRKIPTADEYTLRRRKSTLLFLPLCIILVAVLLWSGGDALRDLIIPGNAAVTEAAVADFVSKLRAGENFGNAITAFCQVIIENANIPG